MLTRESDAKRREQILAVVLESLEERVATASHDPSLLIGRGHSRDTICQSFPLSSLDHSVSLLNWYSYIIDF